MNEGIRNIHLRAVQVATEYKRREAELISVLQEVDAGRVYLHFGVTSLYDYCVRILGLSEGIANGLRSVARKSKEIPALQEAIIKGELTVSKAHRIVSVLNPENQKEWLQIAKTKTSREIEKAVASAHPRLAVKERERFVASDRIELTVGVSELLSSKLKRVVDIESQRRKVAASREMAIEAALDIYLERHDPLARALRSVARVSKKPKTSWIGNHESISENQIAPRCGSAASGRDVSTFDSSYANRHLKKIRSGLPSALVHALNLRDGGQCAYFTANGIRCVNRRWLEFHHVIPLAGGGSNTLENLKTLCSVHHKAIHQVEVSLSRSGDQPISLDSTRA